MRKICKLGQLSENVNVNKIRTIISNSLSVRCCVSEQSRTTLMASRLSQ